MRFMVIKEIYAGAVEELPVDPSEEEAEEAPKVHMGPVFAGFWLKEAAKRRLYNYNIYI